MRTYAVADVQFIAPHLSALGQSLMQNARFSLDGSKVIRCLNHDHDRIQDIFAPGTDIDWILAQCQILSLDEAEHLMTTSEWSEPADPGETA